jgi:hypothetical protein
LVALGQGAKRFQKHAEQRKVVMEWIVVVSPSVSPNLVFHMLGKHVSTVTELPKAAMLEQWMFVTKSSRLVNGSRWKGRSDPTFIVSS